MVYVSVSLDAPGGPCTGVEYLTLGADWANWKEYWSEEFGVALAREVRNLRSVRVCATSHIKQYKYI